LGARRYTVFPHRTLENASVRQRLSKLRRSKLTRVDGNSADDATQVPPYVEPIGTACAMD
jgi:hypothetical protein